MTKYETLKSEVNSVAVKMDVDHSYLPSTEPYDLSRDRSPLMHSLAAPRRPSIVVSAAQHNEKNSLAQLMVTADSNSPPHH